MSSKVRFMLTTRDRFYRGREAINKVRSWWPSLIDNLSPSEYYKEYPSILQEIRTKYETLRRWRKIPNTYLKIFREPRRNWGRSQYVSEASTWHLKVRYALPPWIRRTRPKGNRGNFLFAPEDVNNFRRGRFVGDRLLSLRGNAYRWNGRTWELREIAPPPRRLEIDYLAVARQIARQQEVAAGIPPVDYVFNANGQWVQV